MNTLIDANNSSLKTTFIEKGAILDLCVREVDATLLVNPPIKLYGKEMRQRRNVGFYSDESVGYLYSGKMANSMPLGPYMSELLCIVNKLYGSDFNGILVNKYKDGTDYISFHSDDEKYLDSSGVVTISTGSERIFRIKDKLTNKTVISVPTTKNMFIHMGGDFQKHYTHGIPVQKKIKEPRWSFTFRKHML